MKNSVIIFFLILVNLTFGQTKIHKEKFRQLEPDIWLSIWDIENSSKSIQIDTLSYDEIPKYFDFRGTVVEALKWTDVLGENILIQSVTGHFNWKDYVKDSTDYMIQDKSELYAYLFQKNKADKVFKKKWRIYDFTECFGVDMYTGFIKHATTLTDIDTDGIVEISIPYILICRGGMDPGVMKIMMYEDSTKYALRGSTAICIQENYGGEYTADEFTKKNKIFYTFLKERWELHKCEKRK